jgi:hypothetical protein
MAFLLLYASRELYLCDGCHMQVPTNVLRFALT